MKKLGLLKRNLHLNHLACALLLSFFVAGCSQNQTDATEADTADMTAGTTGLDEAIETPSVMSGVSLETRSKEGLGEYLTDADGRSLYIFMADSPNTSTCSGDCATAWPPLESDGTPTAAAGLDAALVGTIQRSDGTTQVTYNGWPLYYFVKDQAEGETTGQDIEAMGAEWYLISPAGSKVEG